MASLFDHPITPPLRLIIAQVKSGDILIPEFQRPFVWRDRQRIELLDSVGRELPIGALMVWRTKKHRLHCHTHLGPYALPQPPDQGPWTYLIDGHQRIATLYAALTEPTGEEVVPEVRWPVYIDLSADPVEYLLRAKKEDPRRVPVHTLLRNTLVFEAQKELWSNNYTKEATTLEQLANRFKDYPIPIIPLVSEDIGQVVNAFARVNRSGTSMSEAHLASALAYNRFPLQKKLEWLEERLKDHGWSKIDRMALLTLLKLRFKLNVYRSPITTLLDHLGGANPEEFEETFNTLYRSIGVAIAAYRGIGIYGSHTLPYTIQFLLLAEALRPYSIKTQPDLTPHLERIRLWFWRTTLLEEFTGATGSSVRIGLNNLKRFLNGGQCPYKGRPVQLPDEHTRWGGVQTTARFIIQAEASGSKELLTLLGQHGRHVVHQLDSSLPRKEFGSWVIASIDVFQQAHRQKKDLPKDIVIQFGKKKYKDLFANNESDEFVRKQSRHIRRLMKKKVEEVGLVIDDNFPV